MHASANVSAYPLVLLGCRQLSREFHMVPACCGHGSLVESLSFYKPSRMLSCVRCRWSTTFVNGSKMLVEERYALYLPLVI